MKRFFIIACVILLVSFTSINARTIRRGRKPMIEAAPKIGLLFGDDTESDFGLDVILNLKRNLGFRLNVLDIHTNGGTTFFLNYNIIYPTIDVLFYLQSSNMNPYIYGGLGFVSHNGSILTLEGGGGFDFYINRNTCFFVEPGLLIMNISNHDTDTNFYISISGGMKFGIM
jgi:hypothetical protein